jgi:hypothetical protein
VLNTGAFRFGTDRSILTSPADGKVKATNAAAGEAMIYSGPKTITTVDSGADANPAATTISPDDANTIILVCNDDDGCTGTLDETGAAAGMASKLVALGGYTTTIADSAGVIETTGGAAIVLTPLDSVQLLYDGAQWIQDGPVNVN